MKKGSLSLSVNAIVVLILAITMLGLGLGFMKGMFGKVSSQVDQAISTIELKNPATADDPFTTSAREVVLNKQKSVRIDFGIYNGLADPATYAWDDGAGNAIGCQMDTDGDGVPDDTTGDFVITTVPPRTINSGQNVIVSVKVDALASGNSGTHVCSFPITLDDATNTVTYGQDVFITVR